MRCLTLGVFLGVALAAVVAADDCEVCVTFLGTVLDSVEKKKGPLIESKLTELCEVAEGKDKQLCYYIDTIKKDISQPGAMGVPPQKICERLAKKDAQVCELTYPRKTSLKDTDLNKLRVKQLRKILSEYGTECTGCTEKSEFIAKIKSVAHNEL